MDEQPLTMHDVREAYARGANIMGLFRERTGSVQNSTEAVLAAYDLQAGSYRRLLDDPGYLKRKDHNTTVIARVLSELDGDSLLDAGVGEATTLGPVVSKISRELQVVAGFDLSWSRLAHARQHLRSFSGPAATLFTGDLFHCPIANDSFDIVYTSHALEPNHGREREALAELARVSRKWIVLFEPTFELGDDETRRAIEQKGYVRGLVEAARTLGLEVVRHELAGFICAPGNETGLLLLRKASGAFGAMPSTQPWLACPHCQRAMRALKGSYFCSHDALAFPLLDGIPCLLPGNGIVASQFGDEQLSQC